MLTILRLLSTLAALIQLAGLLLRVALVGLIGALALRISGLLNPQLLPAYWLMLVTALIVVAPSAWAAGHDEARRAMRDKAIGKVVREYEDG